MNTIARAASPLIASAIAAAFACNALAQLSPERLYYGLNQPINIRVTTPDNIEIDTAILLQRPDGTDIKVTAPHFPGLQFGRLLPGAGKVGWSFEAWSRP